MSTGLLDQIRAYASDIDSSQPPVTADEVAERIDLVRELPVGVPRTRSARGVWTMVAVAALVALLLAVPLLVSRLRSDTPPATVPDAPTTTAPTVDALPLSSTTSIPDPMPVSLSAPGWSWSVTERADETFWILGSLASGDVLGVSSDGRGAGYCGTLVGPRECDAENPPANGWPMSDTPTLTVMGDGGTQRVELSGIDRIGGDGGLHDGTWVVDVYPEDGSAPVMWLTSDGVTWEERPLADGLDAHEINHNRFVFRDELVIGYGEGGNIVASDGPGQPFEVVYQRNPDAYRSASNVFELDGTFFALVDEWTASGEMVPSSEIVRSSDGHAWEVVEMARPLPASGDLDNVVMRHVQVVNGTAIAVWMEDLTLRAARSTDGLTWETLEPVDAAGNSIATGGFGRSWDGAALDDRPRVRPTDEWVTLNIGERSRAVTLGIVSRDGRTWYRLPDNDAAPQDNYRFWYIPASSQYQEIWTAVPANG